MKPNIAIVLFWGESRVGIYYHLVFFCANFSPK